MKKPPLYLSLLAQSIALLKHPIIILRLRYHSHLTTGVVAIALSMSLTGCNIINSPTEPTPKTEFEAEAEAPIKTVEVTPAIIECKNSIEGYFIVGEAEYVGIEPENIRLKARIDSGAGTTSLGVTKLDRFERDGKPWVRFSVESSAGTLTEFKRPILRVTRIKRHNAEPVKRIVVQLQLHIADKHDVIEVNLADREQYEYPLLIGRNYLRGRALIDVNRKFAALGEES